MKLHTRLAGKQVSSDTARLKQKKFLCYYKKYYKKVSLKIFNTYQNYLSRDCIDSLQKKESLRWTFAIILYEFRIRYSAPSISFRKIVMLIELSRKWVGRERYIIIRLAQTNLFLVSQSKHVYNNCFFSLHDDSINASCRYASAIPIYRKFASQGGEWSNGKKKKKKRKGKKG